jgi:hypothetical protein
MGIKQLKPEGIAAKRCGYRVLSSRADDRDTPEMPGLVLYQGQLSLCQGPDYFDRDLGQYNVGVCLYR